MSFPLYFKGYPIGEMYQRGEITPVSMEEYIERTISFLEYLSPDIVVQRLIGRAPEERTLFCNWGRSWWKVQELLEKKMEEENRFQGKKYNYLSSVSFFDG